MLVIWLYAHEEDITGAVRRGICKEQCPWTSEMNSSLECGADNVQTANEDIYLTEISFFLHCRPYTEYILKITSHRGNFLKSNWVRRYIYYYYYCFINLTDPLILNLLKYDRVDYDCFRYEHLFT